MIELTLKADRRLAAARARDTHFVLLTFRAPRLQDPRKRPGLNLSLVLDRSGSMAGENKLPLAKHAAELALARLTPRDRFSLVAYDDCVQLLVPSTPATPEQLNEARLALRRVETGGSTALFDGYLRGAEQIAERLGEGDLGKVLLLTDGLANVGLQEPAAIIKHVAALRERGVQTSTFGVGADFNQLLLDGMARAGGGNFYFVESPTQLADLLTSEVGEALETVARDVRVAVECSHDVQVRSLDAFVEDPHIRGVRLRLVQLTSGQVVELLYEVDLPGRAAGEVSTLRFAVSDADGALGAPAGVVEFRHATDAEVESEQTDADVLHRAARRVRLQAGERAYSMQYQGLRGEVRREASAAIEYLRRLAKRDPQVAGLVAELERDVAEAEAPMSAMEVQQQMYASSRPLRGRDAAGKALKEIK
jgi:Ca-activated chloride channel family protein